ncbi:MAG: sigma-54-dependent transcriptional regulator [Planctomycetia bacterium]
MSRILIVDDEPAIGWSLRELFTDEGHAVETAATVDEGLESCARFAPDTVLLDVRLPGRDGIAALPEFRALVPRAPVVVMTAFGDLDTAVRAVRAGAFDYLVKPFDLDRAAATVSRALAEGGLATGAAASEGRPSDGGQPRLIGSSPAMQEVFRQISLVAASDLPVLITGATGTGKDVAARALHAHSHRQAGPFVAVSLAALAPSVLESELFGHVRGAFTGATADRPGLFELADGGTLFLDEIGEVPLDVQVKLLRAVESREVVRMGSATPRAVDVRVIAATNRHLPEAVASGTFRTDLYHRLRVFPIRMPALAERGDDVELLAGHFLAGAAVKDGMRTMAPDFLAALRSRPWPGNLRELKHAVEYAAVISRGGTLRAEHLPPQTLGAADTDADTVLAAAVTAWVDAALDPSPDQAQRLHARLLDVVEPALVARVLAAAQGNRTLAARMLGLDRATLRSRLSR